MIGLWIKGLLAHRLPRLAASGAGIALAVAMIGLIGLFAAASQQDMTRRAVRGIPVDWQVALTPGTDAAALTALLRKHVPTTAIATVDYAAVPGFSAVAGTTTQTTGAGVVLGVPPDYLDRFPGQVRALAGKPDGVLIAQQAAANLHVGPGDVVSIAMADGGAAKLTVDGVVDLPNAESMFQSIGPSKAAAPSAPPDNVLLVPAARWAALFPASAAGFPAAGTSRQLHVRLDHAGLPNDPGAAYVTASQQAHHVEVLAAGAATIADDLAARLDAVRGDALYAGVLFLFLGAPGAVLAALLTAAVVLAGRDRRRREQALLRLRGASPAAALGVAGIEAAAVASVSGMGGAVLALGLAAALGIPMADTGGLPWLAAATVAGMATAATAVMLPAWADLRASSVATARRSLTGNATPIWQRLGLDLLLLALSAALFWRTAGTGYQVVLAPEGVAATAVDYPAFLAPLALWIGGGLTALRLSRWALGHGRVPLARAIAPFAARLADTIAASVTRERGRIATGVVMTALAISFGIAVAVFDTTYEAQGRVDAQLTNGADVTVTGTARMPAGDRLRAIRAVPGVAVAEPMQHRHAYVGHDLQDLYGIDPRRIGRATAIVDAHVAGGDARGALDRLAATPDGVLVSQETINDFQLAIGDLLKLRLDAADGSSRTSPFHVVGVVNEFPTAPRDSFLVANAAYLAAETGRPGAELVLVRTADAPARVAEGIRRALGRDSPLAVTDIGQASRLIGSSLTAVDLRGLTGIELGFAVALVAASTGLVLALGFVERRRSLAVLWALGARPGISARFLWTEGLLVLGGGGLIGTVLGFAVAAMLVKLLTGVFDPPPDALSVPWVILSALFATAAVAVLAAVLWAARRPQSRADLGAELPR